MWSVSDATKTLIAQPKEHELQGCACDIPNFRLHKVIGRGGFAEVWLATEVLTGIRRAIKIVGTNPATHGQAHLIELAGVQKYQRVSQNKPHLMQIQLVGEVENAIYMVLELADGMNPEAGIEAYQPKTLAHVITQAPSKRLPPEECLTIIEQVLRGLSHLHDNDLVHRDIKPQNILYVNGMVKLGDPGLVTFIESEYDASGTVGYSPRDDRRGPSRDLFAVGRLLYHLLTGLHPTKFPDLPPELANLKGRAKKDLTTAIRLMNRAAHHEPTQGFQCVAEMKRAIEDGGQRKVGSMFVGVLLFLLVLAVVLFKLKSNTATAPPQLVSARIIPGEFAHEVELRFADGHLTRFQPGGERINTVASVDFEGDGDRHVVVGFSASASEYAGAIAVFDPIEFKKKGSQAQPIYESRLCETPPEAFHEKVSACHGNSVWAGDLDGRKGEELIVAFEHYRGPAHFVLFAHGWQRLGDYWHFGWPNAGNTVMPKSFKVDDRICVPISMTANVIPNLAKRDLADETYHSAVLVLDYESFVLSNDLPKFWSTNKELNESSKFPPVAYGYVVEEWGGATRLDSWSVQRMDRFSGVDGVILQLNLKNSLELDLDGRLNLLEARVRHRASFGSNDLDPKSIWIKSWPQ